MLHIIYFNLRRKQIATASLAVYLLLFSASYYLHSPNTASRAHYGRSARIDMDVLRLAAAACCDMGWISAQRTTDQCRKRLEACINAEGGHSEVWTLAVTLLVWHSSCHTLRPVFFKATDDNPQLALFKASNVRKNAINLQSDEKVL